MKPFVRALPVLLVLCSFASVARAHPGHDDPELTWDIRHLAAHPGATILCFGALAACGYIAYRLACWSREATDQES